MSKQRKEEDQQDPEIDPVKQAEMLLVESKRNAIFEYVQIVYANAKSCQKGSEYLQTFLDSAESIDDLREQFNKLVSEHNRLLLTVNPSAKPNFKSMIAFEDLYCRIKRVMKQATPAAPSQATSPAPISPTDSRTHADYQRPALPTIELMSFNGDIRNWPLFYANFKSTIHEHPLLTDDQKLTYLLGKLSPEAQTVISGIAPNGKNYSLILKSLIDSYEDVRTLAYTYLDQMFNYKATGSPTTALYFKNFLDKFVAAKNGLVSLEIENLTDFILVYIALHKLDKETARSFEHRSRNKKLPTFDQLVQHITEQKRVEVACNTYEFDNPPARSRNTKKITLSPHSYVTVSPQTNTKCMCGTFTHEHMYKCPAFNELSPTARFENVKKYNACINCLSLKHKLSQCTSKSTCRTCSKNHHTMLHFNNNNFEYNKNRTNKMSGTEPATASQHRTSAAATPPPPPEGQRPTTFLAHTSTVARATAGTLAYSAAHSTTRQTVLLSTARVTVYDTHRRPLVVKCLLDTGSQSNFITSDLAKRLGLQKDSRVNMKVRGFGGIEKSIKGSVDIKIFSRINCNIKFDVSCLVVDRITEDLPTVPVDISAFAHIKLLPLADDSFDKPAPVDLLLGASIFPHLLSPGTVHSDIVGIPPAINSVFGYILMGTAPAAARAASSVACCAVVDEPLDRLLKKFWELEEVSATPAYTQADLECEDHFRATTTRAASGRYIVALPFKDDPYKLGDSFTAAHRRFLCLERKLQTCSVLRTAYDEILREYLSKGYVSEVGLIDNISLPASYFVPHFCVQRHDKTSTKVRMVLDSSCKTSTNLSLNDILHSGPNIQGDLNSILLNFRLFKIAISADCRQMFLQIGMRESDRKYQRILFRFNPQDPIKIYEFNRVCFGMTSSVYHALRVVRQIIDDEGHKYPVAASIASSSTFMDDVCFSIMADDLPQNDVTTAVTVCTELIQLFKCGQFDLVKWTSNSKAVLSAIPASHRASSDLEIDKTVPHKVLGTHWDRASDEFFFKVNTPDSKCTKRCILSVVARLWDNLGFVAPVVLYAKLLIQELWIIKCDWDETPPKRIVTLWRSFCSELASLNEIRVPRHLGIVQGCSVNLIGFADASLRAYGCVIYLQVIHGSHRSVRLVCSKSKVSPVKTISVARLELCAVVLLSRLMRKVIENFDSRYKISNIFGFTDSKVVLCWISSSPHRWQTFVANRVTQVIDNLPASCFHHVAGTENPADCLSRGLSPANLANHPLWFNGPPWAIKDPSEWPISELDRDDLLEIPEAKSIAHVATNPSVEPPLYELAHRVSSWSRLLRIVVYIHRFLKKLPRNSHVSRSDLEFAEIKILLAVQTFYFSDDIKRLNNNSNCSPAIQKLKPFLDEHGLLRVGGRLSYASIDYSQMHPCVLPRHDHVVDLIIDYFHLKYLHAGPELLMSLLRRHYWILSARRVIRHRIHKCNTCFRAKPRPSFPLMADLPSFRVNQVQKPFIHTGCDYAGPIQYTPHRGRGVRSRKAWLCIFTCLTTRCLHIEIATELSTTSFLAALKRFLSRRGPIQCLYTDNGTNFVGCRNYLRDLYGFLEQFRPHFEHELSESRIEMKRIPALSPHWGGCWESMVKVVKTHLFKVIGQQTLSYEELLTVLTQIEALVNSRPLTALSNDPSEPTALTPAHFLHTAPLFSLPAPHVESANLRERHLLLDKMVQSFWKRWHMEYLHQLQARAKWTLHTTPIQVGTVVVIITDNAPPLSWPLGVVDAVHPSKDGATRVVTVRTGRGNYVRSVVRLCPLPNQ